MPTDNPAAINLGIKKFIPAIIWFFFLLVLICTPGKDLPKNEWTQWLDSIHFDKLVHAGLFGILIFLFCRPFRKAAMPKQEKIDYFIKIAIAGSIWGLATEFIQKLVPGRSFDLLDWAADSLGVFAAFLFCRKKFA